MQQESLFSKAYHPLAQQYFSAGLVWSGPCLGGSSSTTTSVGGGSSSTTSGGSHVTYPIMFLYTAYAPLHCEQNSHGTPLPQIELDRQTDKHVWKHYLPANYVCGR